MPASMREVRRIFTLLDNACVQVHAASRTRALGLSRAVIINDKIGGLLSNTSFRPSSRIEQISVSAIKTFSLITSLIEMR